MNVLSSQALPGTDFRDPAQVLRGLNKTFEMERHDNKYFTIWYGVYNKGKRQLVYAGGGHPPALLFTGPDAAGAKLNKLESQGPMVGAWPDCPFESGTVDLGAFAQLFLFSDGVFEISPPEGPMWQLDDFVQFMTSQPRAEAGLPDRLLAHVRKLHGVEILEDDFSLVEVTF
jgi:sigma-B regulation protein RsbU (phosphoserine phosphatase)